MVAAPPTKPRAALKPVEVDVLWFGVLVAPPTKPRAALKQIDVLWRNALQELHHPQSRVRH